MSNQGINSVPYMWNLSQFVVHWGLTLMASVTLQKRKCATFRFLPILAHEPSNLGPNGPQIGWDFTYCAVYPAWKWQRWIRVETACPEISVYLIWVVGVRTEAALIQIPCGFRGACNALNTHSTSMGGGEILNRYIALRTYSNQLIQHELFKL